MRKRTRRQGSRGSVQRTPWFFWRWYVEADSTANSVIARRYSADEHAQEGVRCADGVCRDLWELPIEFIDHLLHEQTKLNPKFRIRIFLDKGNGEIKPYTQKRLATHDERLLAS